MKIRLLVNFVHRTQHCVSNEFSWVGKRRWKMAGEILVALPEWVQLYQAQTPSETLDTLREPSSVDLLLLRVLCPAQELPLACGSVLKEAELVQSCFQSLRVGTKSNTDYVAQDHNACRNRLRILRRQL